MQEKEFKNKPFRERDKDLLSLMVITKIIKKLKKKKDPLHKKSSGLYSQMWKKTPFSSNEGFYKFLKLANHLGAIYSLTLSISFALDSTVLEKRNHPQGAIF